MSNHHYDRCDDGICMKCDRCQRSECCEQTEECKGQNWLTVPIFICPNRFDSTSVGHPINHQIKWNGGEPFCLGCSAKAVFYLPQKEET